MTTKKQRHAEVLKRASTSNVQAGTPVQAGVGMRLNSLITMMRSQNVQALDRIFQDSSLKCPSGSQYLKDLDMDMNVDLIWLPIDRVAMLLNKNLKTTQENGRCRETRFPQTSDPHQERSHDQDLCAGNRRDHSGGV